MIEIEFIKNWRDYSQGKLANFDEKEAARLIALGVAKKSMQADARPRQLEKHKRK